MKKYTRVHAAIDLDAIASNVREIKRNLPEQTGIMAVVKADGYGHGALEVSRRVEAMDCVVGFAVATMEEAISLRRHGIQKKILILGAIFEEQYEPLVAHDVTLPIYDLETAKGLSEVAQRLGKKARLHFKLDTAMSRLGVPADAAGVELALQISRLPGLELEGVFTHFSTSDERDKATSNGQIALFRNFVKACADRGLTFRLKHCCNSAGAIDLSHVGFDFVRLGISLYGMYPSEEVHQETVRLQPALSLHSHVCFLKEIEAGTKVGYGGTYQAKERIRVATVPVGYGDGYPRLLSNKGYVLIRGQRAPIIGRVCMDQFMVDVTHVENVSLLDPVTLVGRDGDDCIRVEDLSQLCGRFNYEFVCDLGKRIPRTYWEGGRQIGSRDYFDD